MVLRAKPKPGHFRPLPALSVSALLALIVNFSIIGEATAAEAPKKDLDEVGKKLANPLADLWALNFNSFVPGFFDGDVNKGDAKLGATTIFQPILPVPLSGEGADEFRVILRPVVPIVWGTPTPDGIDKFDYNSGIGDMQLPFVFSVPDSIAGKWILGAGPVFEFPTATDDALGADQWSAGPAIAVGHKGEKLTSVLFFNYFWGFADAGQGAANHIVARLKGQLHTGLTVAEVIHPSDVGPD